MQPSSLLQRQQKHATSMKQLRPLQSGVAAVLPQQQPRQQQRRRRSLVAARAAPPAGDQQQQQQQAPSPPQAQPSGGGALNEDMLAQLRAAQEEAARLKAELASLQQQQQQDGNGGDVEGGGARRRIDSMDSRELPWGPGKRVAWLSEADVDFFTGGGATEQAAGADAPLSPEAAATVTRRLVAGGAIAAGLAAFALVPTKDLRVLKPSKPLFVYITSLLEAQAQLEQCGALVDDAAWDTLRLVLPRIRGPPIDADAALRDIISLLDAKTAARAEPLAAEFREYLEDMDFRKYYDTMPAASISGAQNAEFVKFSGDALKAAKRSLKGFIALLPAEDVEAARTQLASRSAALE